MAALIEIRDVVNRFGAQTVHDGASLTLEKGEVLGLVGGSGSGKSVLLKTILGLNKPETGEVRVFGKDVYGLSDAEKTKLRKKWGVLFQDGALFSGFDVLDNVGVPLREHTGMKEKDIAKTALSKLETLGLEREAARKFPSELSGGMARRAALARAMALDPELLFLDEPTGALDPVAAAAFDRLVLSMREELGLSVLIITHDLDTISTVCDRVAMIVDRKIVAGTLEEMTASKNPEVREFFNGPRMHNIQKRKRK
jgi:phospholipid/cholesterol/gamma-HCH transport system ATP-binding protein